MKNHYVMITEHCKCGAKIEIEHTSLKEAEEFLMRWRVLHTHLTTTTTTYPQVTWGTGRQPLGGIYTISSSHSDSWRAYPVDPDEGDEPLGVPA